MQRNDTHHKHTAATHITSSRRGNVGGAEVKCREQDGWRIMRGDVDGYCRSHLSYRCYHYAREKLSARDDKDTEPMLKESDVIKHVCNYLAACGFTDITSCNEYQKGHDIKAANPRTGGRIILEAKGETSSKPGTPRYGIPFSGSQVYDHVAKAFYIAAANRRENTHTGIALPETAKHIKQVNLIKPVLAQLQIEVFWVNATGDVKTENNWPLWYPPPALVGINVIKPNATSKDRHIHEIPACHG